MLNETQTLDAGQPGSGSALSDIGFDEHAAAGSQAAAGPAGESERDRLAKTPGVTLVQIDPVWNDLLEEFAKLGEIKTVARNSHAIHKKWGCYDNIKAFGKTGLVLNGDVDLRLFFGAWNTAFVVEAQTPQGMSLSLQTFDAQGDPVQKVFVDDEQGQACLRSWAERFAALETLPAGEPSAATETASNDDADVDVEELRRRWKALKDVHQFRGMLDDLGLDRLQAMRLVGPDHARSVALESLSDTLHGAADVAVPIMVFVTNRGAVQIHSGPVQDVSSGDGWLHVRDERFHLHVRESGIADCWVVTKPTRDGDVTSLEVYDADGNLILQMFGVRTEGQQERADWRALAAGLAPRV